MIDGINIRIENQIEKYAEEKRPIRLTKLTDKTNNIAIHSENSVEELTAFIESNRIIDVIRLLIHVLQSFYWLELPLRISNTSL